MNIRFSIILLFTLIFSGCYTISPVIETSSTPETSRGFYPSGDIRYVYTFGNGKLNGITKEFYRSGKHKADFTYKAGKLIDGKAFFETGELKYRYSYANGKRNGITNEYNKSGQIITKWIYKDGKLH